jgi:hypothetical protein
MRHRRAAAVVAVLLPLVACTDDEPDEPTPSAASSSSPSASPTSGSGAATSSPADPTDEAPPDDASFPADTADDGGPAQPGSGSDPAGRMRVTGLRLAGHDGFARLVVDLGSSSVPEWAIGYSEPSGPGGGPVDIAGDAFLRLQLRTGTEPGGRSRSDVSASPGPIVQARTTGSFEGHEEVLIGIRDGELPFRAFALTDPGRIVVDVRPGG